MVIKVIEDKDRQLSGFLEVLVSYHGISKLTIEMCIRDRILSGARAMETEARQMMKDAI